MLRFNKLWNLFGQRDNRPQARKQRGFQPQVEAFEDRLVPALPSPTSGLISGVAFLDANKNNVRDAGEAGIPGLQITLTGTTTTSVSVVSRVTTDADGTFTFQQLKAGTYALTRNLGKQIVGTTLYGNLGGSRGSTAISNITLGDGQVASGYTFAIRGVGPQAVSLRNFLSSTPKGGLLFGAAPGPGEIVTDNSTQPLASSTLPTEASSQLSGWVYDDANSDGVQGGAEAGLKDVAVILTGIDDTGKSILDITTTSDAGFYEFTLARPGTYTVQLLEPVSGFRAGVASVGSGGGLTVRNTQIFGINVVAGSNNTDYRFAQLASATPTPSGSAPALAAELVDDTAGPGGAATASDGITSDPSIRGSILGNFPIKKLLAGFTAGSVNVNVTNALAPGNTFYLNEAQLAQIAGGTLTQGSQTLFLRAVDAKGHVSATIQVNFDFDNGQPQAPTLALASGFDDGTNTSDGRTTQTLVNLAATTSAGSTVELFQGNSATPIAPTSSSGQDYSFNNITLASGVNNFVIRARDAAGNLSQFETFFVVNQDPTVATALDPVTVAKNAPPTVLDLSDNFADADTSNSIIRLTTNFGNIDIELFDTATPQTVANFLNYITSNRFDNTIFHRLDDLGNGPLTGPPDILQGGGFKIQTGATTTFPAVSTDAAIKNEFSNSRPNVFGTIAMAKTNTVDSATSQFFFNLTDNTTALNSTNNGGFTVFGRILSGTDQRVVNTMSSSERQNRASTNGAFTSLPVQNLPTSKPLTQATAANLLVVTDVTVLRQTEGLTYTIVGNDNTALVTPTITNERLSLAYATGATGTANITVRATDKFGASVDTALVVTVNA